MRQHVHRGVLVGIGIAGAGLIAVACATAPGIGSASGPGRAVVGGFSFQVPVLPNRVTWPGSVNATSTTAQSQSTLQGATHSGEGCPIALPQQ
jgi:hypothetical protein